MFLRLTDIRCISKGALGGSNRKLSSTKVSNSLPNQLSTRLVFLFRDPGGLLELATTSSSLLIQINSLRRNNHVFTLVVYKRSILMSKSKKRFVPCHAAWHMTTLSWKASRFVITTHRTRKHFYITSGREKDPASLENYASELHQVMIQRLSRVGRTSCE